MIKPNLTLAGPEDLWPGIISQLGYPGPEAVCDRVWDQIKKSSRQCCDLAAPRALCRATPVKAVTPKKIQGRQVCLETVNWARLANRMTGVREIFCLAVTLGKAVDEKIHQLGRRQMLSALILDAAASILAEYQADAIHQQITGHYAQQGLSVSALFSPGYCDWPLSEGQKDLSRFLSPEAIGLQVSSSGLMTPRKSVTAVAIAAEKMPGATPCFLCARDCPHRRATYQPAEIKG